MASDLVVIGGGVMGLFTAYHAAERSARVVVLERGRIGDPMTASYGRTRSFRNDYLDATYARLAKEAFRLWGEFEEQTATDVLVRCGCMNIAKRSVTPDLAGTYAQMSHETLLGLGMKTDSLDRDALQARFPYLDADMARLEADAGVVDLAAVTRALTAALAERGVRTVEDVAIESITRAGEAIRVRTDAGDFETRSLVVCAGHGTNDVLAKLPGPTLRVPLSKDRPSEAKYFVPPEDARERFTADAMPVIAYLDAGIYCHPIVDGVVDAVKIGYYNPPDIPRGTTSIDSIASFVEQCMPGLAGADVRDVEDVDQCEYDLVADDDFVLGAVPGVANTFVGVGWRGTGYKFAPWVGRVLAELALQDGTVYEIDRFDPARFSQTAVPRTSRPSQRTLEQRLADGVMIGAEGYVFELERRGYVKAGPFVPEVILDHPDALRQLHREFLRAGSDVMVALTYYAHRDKLKAVGRDGDLEQLNRAAVRIANEIAAEGGALVAGNICNTWSYDPADPVASGAAVRAQYEEQLGWAVEEGVDFVIAETNDYVGEALIALEVCQAFGLPAMVTFASVQADTTFDGYDYVDACRILAERGAALVGLNCSRGPETMLPLLERIRAAVDIPVAAQPVPYRTSPATPAFESLASGDGRHLFPLQLEPYQCTRFEMAEFAQRARDIGVAYIGVCCGGGPHHVRAMAEALGRETPASVNSPALELHPVLGAAGNWG